MKLFIKVIPVLLVLLCFYSCTNDEPSGGVIEKKGVIESIQVSDTIFLNQENTIILTIPVSCEWSYSRVDQVLNGKKVDFDIFIKKINKNNNTICTTGIYKEVITYSLNLVERGQYELSFNNSTYVKKVYVK